MAKGKQSSPSPYGKGRRRLSDAPGGGNYGEKWHQKLEYLPNPKKGQPKEIRIVGGVFTIFQHYVRFKRKDGSKGGFYELCPNWDWENGEFRRGPDATCPLCADFNNEDLPADLRMLGSFRYYMDAFDVTAAKAGNTDVFGVIYTNKYGKNDLAMIADITGHDIDDPDNGSSVFWHFDENAKDPKDRVRFYQGKKLPIKWNPEKNLFMMGGGGKKFIGKQTDYEGIIEVKDPEEIRSDLKRLGLYARLEEVMDVINSRIGDTSKEKSGGGSRAASTADDGEWGDDSDATPPKKRRGRPPKKQKEEPAATSSDDDTDESWGDDTPAKGKSRSSASSDDDSWGGGDDEKSSKDADDSWGDEDDDTPKKKGGKKASKSDDADDSWGDEDDDTPKKKGGKKASKSDDSWGDDSGSASEASGDDGWGDDGGDGWDDDKSAKGKKSKAAADDSDDDDPDSW